MGSHAPIEVLAVSRVACAAVAWRAGGALRVTFIVKATFALTPDEEAALIEPAPLEREDRYQEQDPARSLRRGSDLAPYLPGVGVVLVGHAYAPTGSPVTGLSARLAIYGDAPLLDKTVHVYGEVPPGGSAPAPFLKMPLVYERAYGGPSVPSNPVGVGLSGTRRPNLVHPTNPHRPAGFGPVAPRWPARRRLFGELEGPARPEEIAELPADLDFRAFHAAPADQQLAGLGEAPWIVLDNMRAGLARVRTRLPAAQARARWHLGSVGAGAEQEIELTADTLALDTDLQTASLVWRGSVALSGPEQLAQVRASAGLSLGGAPIAWLDAAAVGRATAGRGVDVLAHTGTAVMSPFARPALPFDDQDVTLEGPSPLRARPPVVSRPAREISPELAAMIAAGEMPDDPLNRTGPMVAARIAEPALPFNAEGAPRFAPPFVSVVSAPEPEPAAPPVAAVSPARREVDPEGRARARALLAEGGSFDDADFAGADLSDLDFSGRSLRRCQLAGASLRGALLKGARLEGARLEEADLSAARLDDADLGGADLSRAVLTGASLDGARLGEAVLEEATLDGASLVKANLDGARLARSQGEGAKLDGASLRRADLRLARFPRASFVGAVMREAQADQGDFTGARFLRADLGLASFRKARLPGAVLAHATLEGTDLRHADLEGVNLHGAARRSAKMAGANTRGLVDEPPEASG